MADRIHIHQGKVNEGARQIGSAAAYLANAPLSSQDTRTTLPANAKSKAAYGRLQERIADLGRNLDQEAGNIRSLNAAFTEFDRMIGQLGGGV